MCIEGCVPGALQHPGKGSLSWWWNPGGFRRDICHSFRIRVETGQVGSRGVALVSRDAGAVSCGVGKTGGMPGPVLQAA